MAIPRGTHRFVGLREVAERLGVTHPTVRHWWAEGRLIGRLSAGETRSRVVVPVEVVEFYLRFCRLPTKLDLLELDALTHEFLLELGGPDGGLCEVELPSQARPELTASTVS